MPIEEPSNADDLPKLLIAEEGDDYLLVFEEQDIKKYRDAGPPTTKKGVEMDNSGWSCYRIEDLVVITDDKHETEIEEGTNEIPFWAMKQFFEAYSALSTKQKKGEIKFSYTRGSDRKTGKNNCVITVEEWP